MTTYKVFTEGRDFDITADKFKSSPSLEAVDFYVGEDLIASFNRRDVVGVVRQLPDSPE